MSHRAALIALACLCQSCTLCEATIASWSVPPQGAGPLAALAALSLRAEVYAVEEAEGEQMPDFNNFRPEQVMEDWDEDKDGFLTFEDFLASAGADVSEAEKVRMRKMIKAADADEDGKINVAELPTLLRQFAEGAAEQEL